MMSEYLHKFLNPSTFDIQYSVFDIQNGYSIPALK